MIVRWFTAAFVCLLMTPENLRAQHAESGAQAVVAAAFLAEEEGNVGRLVSLVDPEAMAAFKQRQLDHDMMFDAFRSNVSTLSDSASPEAQAMAAELRSPRKTLLQGVFKVRDRSEFERLTPEQVLTRWFLITTKRPEPPAGFPDQQRRRDIIGEVADRDGIVHVVFRESWTPDSLPGIPGRREPQIRVISVKETSAGWRVMLNGGLVYDEGSGWSIGWGDDDEAPAEAR
jgi:hypothetical protein